MDSGPVHDLRYQDLSGERRRAGVGDIRASLRFGPELVGAPEIPLALRAGVKLPGTTFPVDATIIPLSEGQRDWELSVESGGAFNRGAVTTYVVGWVGYRWRERSETSGRDPGDEVFGHVGIGGQLGGLRLELGAEAMFGRAPRQLGFQIPTGRRRLLQFQQTLGYGVGPGTLEFTSTLPVTGRSLPTGPSWSVGYRIGWGSQ